MRPQLLTPIKLLYSGTDDRKPEQPDSDRVFDNLSTNAMAQVLYVRGALVAGFEFNEAPVFTKVIRVIVHKQVLNDPNLTAGNIHQPAEVMFNSQIDGVLERWKIQSIAPAIIKGDPLQRLPYTELTCDNLKRSALTLPAQELCWDGDEVTWQNDVVVF